jgi:GABA(A) receptor-associated protein
MNITNSYSAQGILQPSFASQSQHTEITTQTVRIHTPPSTPDLTTMSAALPTNDCIERVKKSQVILEKYPDRVPLIIQPSKNDRDTYPIDKSKYITPRDLTMMQLQQIIRKRIRFPHEKALFMFIDNKIFPITSMIGNIYDDYKDSDGFLYVTYCQENTFGTS